MMWTNGLIAAAVVGSIVALVVVCCWLSSLVQCVQHMYKYWCSCCHKNSKDYYDVRTLRHHTRVIFNSSAGETTTTLNRASLPPSYSSIFKQELLSSGQTVDNDRQYASVVVHHCGAGDYTSSVSYSSNHTPHTGAEDCQITTTTSPQPAPEHQHNHQFHQQQSYDRFDPQASIDSDSVSYCPSLYSLDRELYNKRPHFYQLVFTQSPDDEEAEYPNVDSPFINFPRRSLQGPHHWESYTPGGHLRSPHRTENTPRDIYTRSRMMSHPPDVLRDAVPHTSKPTAESVPSFVSPPGADVYQYVKRPTQLGAIGPNKRQCVHVLNNSLYNQCRLAFMSDKPQKQQKPNSPTPTAPTVESPRDGNPPV